MARPQWYRAAIAPLQYAGLAILAEADLPRHIGTKRFGISFDRSGGYPATPIAPRIRSAKSVRKPSPAPGPRICVFCCA